MKNNLHLQRILEEDCKNHQLSGLIARIEVNNFSWAGCAGNLDSDDIERGFYICSLSKTFTAIAILKLFEKRKFNLDNIVSDFISINGYLGNVEIKKLLNHSSRIVDYTTLDGYLENVYAHPTEPWSQHKILSMVKGCDLLSESDLGSYYSNTNYLLLRLILESITNKSFAELIHELVIEPLNLSNTYVATELDTKGSLIPASEPRYCDNDGDIRRQYHPDWCATGLIVSNLKEICYLYRSLFENSLLKEDSISLMTEGIETPYWMSGRNAIYNGRLTNGLGLRICKDFKLGPFYGHTGDCPGYSVLAGYIDMAETEGIVSCIVCNQTMEHPPMTTWMKLIRLIEDQI